MRENLGLVFSLFAISMVGCGEDEEGVCDPVAQSGCNEGHVCEYVVDQEPHCFSPVEIHGRVIDLATGAGISGAHIVGVDVNGAAATGVAVSDSEGNYELAIPTLRTAIEDGTPAAVLELTLRADAQNYESFPGTIRQPLPIDTAVAVATEGGTYVIESSLTEIGLLALVDGGGTGSIKGRVDLPGDGRGILVVAEAAGKGYPVIAALDGDYQIFNLPPEHYVVRAYVVGHVYEVAEVDVAAATVTANLALTDQLPGSLTGKVGIVDGNGFFVTSVVAFVESTFDPLTGRGVPPPGLRAPSSGPPNIMTDFTLENIPPGRYVVVAAFENDGLVRDPDQCIAGTDDVHVEIVAGTVTPAPSEFKVTGALAVQTPGSVSAELVLDTTPTFTWADDSSEDQYLVEVFDAYGQVVWTTTMAGVSGGIPTLDYAGPALLSSMYYQYRVTSSAQAPSKPRCNRSRTEDLKGVFYTP
jgi:hypothetical protein